MKIFALGDDYANIYHQMPPNSCFAWSRITWQPHHIHATQIYEEIINSFKDVGYLLYDSLVRHSHAFQREGLKKY